MQAHYDALKALLATVALLTGKIYDAIRISNGDPVRENYIVLFPNTPAELDDARYMVAQRADARARWRYDIRIVAVDAAGLLQLADAVLSLIGTTPVVAGRVCDRVALVPAVEEGKARHDSVTNLHYLDLSFEFWSRRDS